jgi:hypothetical protein
VHDSYGGEGEFIRKGGKMPGDMIHDDLKDIRQIVSRIDREGCGQAETHSKAIDALWEAHRLTNEKVDNMLTKIIVAVLLIVLTGTVGNWFITSRSISGVAVTTSVDSAAVAENQRLIREIIVVHKKLMGDIEELKEAEKAQTDLLQRHRLKSTYDPPKR